jgi:formyltetrahydrofolate deformylase
LRRWYAARTAQRAVPTVLNFETHASVFSPVESAFTGRLNPVHWLGMKKFATITVIGRDKTGVIARVTNFLFEQRANIEALEEQVTRGQFSMTLQASWKDSQLDVAAVQSGLTRLARSLQMEIKLRFTHPQRRQRLAILVTREPHCFEGLMRSFRSGQLRRAEPALVVANRRDLEPLAKKFKLPFVMIPWIELVEAEAALLKLLEEHEIDFMVLARFMKILSPNVVWRFKNKIINVHPSLLPSFPGAQAYRQAYEHGVKIAGVTSHFVSMHLDEGPIIAQESFAIHPEWSLKEIVAAGQKLETKVVIKAVKLYLAKRLDVYWGTVKQV